MRSVFLEGIPSEQLASDGLSAAFPDQASPTKTVFDPTGAHPIGWLYVSEAGDPTEQLGPYMIQADYSGRLWEFDAKQRVVEAVLRIQLHIGGEFRDYDD